MFSCARHTVFADIGVHHNPFFEAVAIIFMLCSLFEILEGFLEFTDNPIQYLHHTFNKMRCMWF